MNARMMNMVMAIAVLLLGPPGTTGCGGGTDDPGNTQQPVIGDPYQSECLNTFDGESDGTVEVLVDGDAVTVVDHHAEFNCCLAAWMEVGVEQQEITVVEVEDPDQSGACDCICPYELSIRVSNLADGDYTVRVYRYAAEPDLQIHEEIVTVPGTVQSSAYLASFQAACDDCGAEECYGPEAPHGESRFGYEIEPDPEDGDLFRIRATHDVLCIDVGILGAELFVEGDNLVLVEEFDYDNPVDCYYTQQATILIAGVAPGSYTLKIYDNDRQRLLVEEPVTVP